MAPKSDLGRRTCEWWAVQDLNLWPPVFKITVDICGHLVHGANRQEMNRFPSLKSPPKAQESASEVS
jgi:hypothetical protein